MDSLKLAVLVIVASFSPYSMAQDIRDTFLDSTEFKPVKIESEIKNSIGTFTQLSNFVFRPAGEGPFPAVVIMHPCGGIQVPHMRLHGQELLKEGYVVLMLDSFGPRGMQNCARGPLSAAAGVADAYAALAFLDGLPFVDKTRIYQTGYSWGAIVSTLLASPQSAKFVGASLRFRATVSNYSTCVYQGKYHFLLKDTDRPVLMLIGARDEELPPASCFPLLDELKSAGAPVQWYVFPDATHSWDYRGAPNRAFVYSEETSRLATMRMLDFFAQNR